MKVYIAGPITALEDRGFTLDQIRAMFEQTAEELRAKGDVPVNPFDLHPMGVTWENALKADLAGLVMCDAIYFRKGWRQSTGVALERFVAKKLKLAELYEDPEEEKQRSGSERFHEVLEELGALHDKKQRDYGTTMDPFANVRASTEFGIPAWVGSILRGNDKVARIKSMVRTGRLANESVEDSLRDLAVYAIIALVLFEETAAA